MENSLGILRKMAGLTQEQLGERVGLSRTAIKKMEYGERGITDANLIKFSEILGVTADDIRKPKAETTGIAKPLAQKTIPEIDLHAGAGGGGLATMLVKDNGAGISIAEEARKDEGWGLPAGYMSELGVKPMSVHIIEVKGDSMAPTLLTGDRVMVDTLDRQPSPPGMFVVVDEWGGVMVKRIHPIAGSEEPMLRIISDNDQHPEEDWPWNDHTVVGRVVWVARKV